MNSHSRHAIFHSPTHQEEILEQKKLRQPYAEPTLKVFVDPDGKKIVATEALPNEKYRSTEITKKFNKYKKRYPDAKKSLSCVFKETQEFPTKKPQTIQEKQPASIGSFDTQNYASPTIGKNTSSSYGNV